MATEQLPATGVSALLWSASQNALHIEPVEQMLSTNREAYADNRRMDYVPIFFGTDDECHRLASSLRGTIHSRAQTKEAIPA